MLESCRRPDLVTEITLQPVRRHGVDAAILFSDIVVPLAAAGVDLDIVAGTGPVVAEPIRTAARRASDSGRSPPTTSPYVAEAVRLLVAELGATPLIGFAGAPFTLASYLIEGGPSRTYAQDQGDDVRRARRSGTRCCARLADDHAGVPAGAGRRRGLARCSCSTPGPARCPRPTTAVTCCRTRPRCWPRLADAGVPRIHFGVGTGELLRRDGRGRRGRGRRRLARPAGPRPTERIGPGRAVQGNLDPACCSRRGRWSRRRCGGCCAAGRAAPGHVFNLGHGVLPETDPDVLTRVVELVHEISRALWPTKADGEGRVQSGSRLSAAGSPGSPPRSGCATRPPPGHRDHRVRAVRRARRQAAHRGARRRRGGARRRVVPDARPGRRASPPRCALARAARPRRRARAPGDRGAGRARRRRTAGAGARAGRWSAYRGTWRGGARSPGPAADARPRRAAGRCSGRTRTSRWARWCAHRFGDEVVDRLVDPMLGGVYAGRADQLSLAATMPGAGPGRARGAHPARRGPGRAGRRAARARPGRSSRPWPAG